LAQYVERVTFVYPFFHQRFIAFLPTFAVWWLYFGTFGMDDHRLFAILQHKGLIAALRYGQQAGTVQRQRVSVRPEPMAWRSL
jgi:hypothetical protein